MVQEPIRIVFMGTPLFAVPTLTALLARTTLAQKPATVVGVFAQPDRPAGRGQRLTAPPVKDIAVAAHIPVFQPERLRRDGLAMVESLAPDLIIVAAYAHILPQAILDMPRFGTINVHGSLLPKYRGASPIQTAILDGATETGISIMLMDAGLDTGPVLSQTRVPIQTRDTSETLAAVLAQVGATLLIDTLDSWIAGTITPQPQDNSAATLTRILRKSDGCIDWSKTAEEIARQVRAMQPWPGAYYLREDGQPLKIIQAEALDTAVAAKPGTIDLLSYMVSRQVIYGTSRGSLLVHMVQPAGKKPMRATDWYRGAGGKMSVALQMNQSESDIKDSVQ